MSNRARGHLVLYLTLLIALTAGLMAPQTFAANQSSFPQYYGDQNVEQWTSTIGGSIVQAYTMITTPGPILVQIVSIYLQYSGSDGSQCMWFGIYRDDGSGSPAGQPLVASTKSTYCLHGTASWGPDWETWRLRASDALTIPAAGTYWLAVLASQTFATAYHYGISSEYDYTYGYATYFFTTPYSLGFPSVFSSNPSWEGYGPYSFTVGVLSA